MNLRIFVVVPGLLICIAGCQTTSGVRPISANLRQPTVEQFTEQAIQESSSANAADYERADHSYFEPVSRNNSSSARIQQVSFVDSDSVNHQLEDVLAEVEQSALENSPAIQQIRTQIQGLSGQHEQSGLGANPVVGVTGQEINEDGGAGRYGVYFGRQIIRPEKLYLATSVVDAQIEAANQRLLITEQKLLTDVRQRFFQLMVSREKVLISKRLVSVAEKAVDTSNKRLVAKEDAKISVLQSELELQNAIVNLKKAENELQAAKRRLEGFVGDQFEIKNINGVDIGELVELVDFDSTLEELVNASPEISALFADVETARRQLDRENVEALPNVTWQTNLLYDMVGDDVIIGFQLGMPIPSVNWNQGNIYSAQQKVRTARLKVEKRSQALLQQLALEYKAYLDARIQVNAFRSAILPKAKESFELISLGFSEGEIDYFQLLTAQRTLTQTNLSYIDSLAELWRRHLNIRGLLLTGSLE